MVLKVRLLMALLVVIRRLLSQFFGQIVLALLIYGLIFLALQHFRGEVFSIVCIYVSISLADDVYHLAEEFVKKRVK